MNTPAVPLRVAFVALAFTGLLYVAVLAVQVVTVMRPTADALEGLTRDLISDQAAIRESLAELRATRREVALLAPPFVTPRESLPDPAALRRRVTALIDRGSERRASVERAEIPTEMRVSLAEALEQEAQVGVTLLEALRAAELGNGAAAVVALRASGVHSDSTAALLSIAQTQGLRFLLDGQQRLQERMRGVERWTELWIIVGLALFVAMVWLMRTRFYLPVQMMQRAVQRIEAGDLSVEIPITRSDELGELAAHVNAMTRMLRERAANVTEQFGRLLDEATNEICVFDAGTLRLVQANRGARNALGLDDAALLTLRLPDLLGGLTEVQTQQMLEDLRRGALPRVLLATRRSRPDGSLQRTEVSVQYASAGDRPVFITVAEDAGVRNRVRELDERLREFAIAEQAILSSGHLLRAARAITEMAATTLGTEWCALWRVVAQRHEPVCAYRPDHQGHDLAFPYPEDASSTDGGPLCIPVFAGGRRAGVVGFGQSGTPRPWTPEERTFAGAVADLVARVLDAVERRTLEHALERAQRMDSIGQLAGGVAHDFNNILTAILGNLAVTRSELGPEHPSTESLQEAERAALRAAELTRQLLTFARHHVVETQVVDLNARVRDAEAMLRRLLGASVELRTELTHDPLPVRLGSGQAEQVLVNLAVNARDAMPGGGAIVIATRRLAAGDAATAEFPELHGAAAVELTVRDTGSGMDAETRERIFEPFFTTKGVGEGTGLGLAVCYGIVRNAQGNISVDSVLGEGSTFRIVLPEANERSSPARGTREVPRPGAKEVILVAEDEPAIRSLVTRMLRRRGYEVLSAEDGAQLVELAAAQEGPVALLVTDVVMPRMDGVAAAREIRARRPGLPVLFMSGFTAAKGIQEGEFADAGFLAKPFTPEELELRVRELLDRASASASP